ncbi:MAG: hypothetical protein J7501_01440 [Bdellovibrio sp.]|nr:hypothetical protein [Bdellovibrio sp.]
MSSEMGVFALRQIVSSMIVVGPILIMIGAFTFVFSNSRKAVMVYLMAGLILTTVGAINLYREFGVRERTAFPQEAATPAPTSPAVQAIQNTKDRL